MPGSGLSLFGEPRGNEEAVLANRGENGAVDPKAHREELSTRLRSDMSGSARAGARNSPACCCPGRCWKTYAP